MREALEDFESVSGATHPDDYEFIPFHTPFPGMVRKAAVLGYRHMIRDTEVEEELADQIGTQPRRENFDSGEAFEEAIRDYMDELKNTDAYREWYADTIEPTLDISSHVGNWYTGSVHVARMSALKHAVENDLDLAGKRMLVASYGSGAQAEIHEETVQPGFEEEILASNIDDHVGARYDLSWDEYEQVHDRHNHEKSVELEPFTQPESEFVFDGWGPMNERKYTYVEN